MTWCEVCQREFKCQGDLQSHLKLQPGGVCQRGSQVACPHPGCPRTFRTVLGVQFHCQQVHGWRPVPSVSSVSSTAGWRQRPERVVTAPTPPSTALLDTLETRVFYSALPGLKPTWLVREDTQDGTRWVAGSTGHGDGSGNRSSTVDRAAGQHADALRERGLQRGRDFSWS